MISRAYITEWRDKMPWKLDSQVEQDLILSRLLVELFSDNLKKKIKNPGFRKDTEILLSARINYLPDAGYKIVSSRLVELL